MKKDPEARFYRSEDIDMDKVRKAMAEAGQRIHKGVGPHSPQYRKPLPPPMVRRLPDYGPHDESTAPQTVKVNAHRRTRELIDEPISEKAKAVRRFINTKAHQEALARRADIG